MSRGQKIDFNGETWTAHEQGHWLEFAGNPNFPDYLRIMFVAYGRHMANGHARLGKGELVRYLVRKDGSLPDRRDVSRSVNHAIDLGYLHPASRLLCLVVSSHHVQGGRGNGDQPCPRDHTIRKANVGDGDRRSVRNVGSENGRFTSNVGSHDRRSMLASSISSVPPLALQRQANQPDVG